MKNILFSITLALTCSVVAKPIPTPFDVFKFYGNYKFESCTTRNNAPIWSDDIERHFVEISNVQQKPFNLDLYRFSEPATIINLGVSLEHINQGVQIKKDEDGKKVISKIESYTTKDGVYGYQYWNFRDINVGWTTVELKKLSEQKIQYKMKFRRTDDPFTKIETCTLVKVSEL